MKTWRNVLELLCDKKVKILTNRETDDSTYTDMYQSIIRHLYESRRNKVSEEDVSDCQLWCFNEETDRFHYKPITINDSLLDSPICNESDIIDGIYDYGYYYFIFDEENNLTYISYYSDRGVVVFEDTYIFSERKSIFLFNRKTGNTKYVNF